MANETDRKTELLRQAFAPWDERAWDNLLDAYPETAEALRELIDLGVNPEELRIFAEEQHYLEGVGSWLAHAAAHLWRARQTLPEGAIVTEVKYIVNGREMRLYPTGAEPAE